MFPFVPVDRQGYRHLSVSALFPPHHAKAVPSDFLSHSTGQLRQADSPLGRPLRHQAPKARIRRRVRRLQLPRQHPMGCEWQERRLLVPSQEGRQEGVDPAFLETIRAFSVMLAYCLSSIIYHHLIINLVAEI
jgi:hypothetical protein